ncbi:hypothetical protein MHYP_G00279050 [Metynnis hypsauchen]
MENIKKELLNTLEDLVEEDLKRFQWHLINTVEGSTKIPKARLKNTNRQETVDKMVARLGKCKAVEVTLDVLKNMNQNQLAEELGTKYRQAIIWENPKKDTHCRLETLRVEHAGENRIKPGLRKYACKITLDPNTAHTQLTVSEDSLELAQASQEQTGRVGTLIAFSTVSCSFGQGPFQQPDPG